MARRVFVAAGEASGDRHLDHLLEQLETLTGPLELRGLGGQSLVSRGGIALAGPEELSVLGFSEVLRRLPYFVRLMQRCTRELESWKPDLALFVDYPGFNLRLARRARAMGIPVVYYIAPQVWAWRKDRRPGIARAVDHLLVVFPFEEPLFREAGIRTTFVGHPLLDAPVPSPEPGELRRQVGATDGPMLALLPGSRAQEVRGILPTLMAGASRLEGVHVVISRSAGLPHDLFAEAARMGFALWDGSAAALTRAADAALVASGTATLETGLQGTPMAVVYRTGAFNFQIAKRVVSLRTVGLVNIASGGDRVPELLQGDLTPERVAETARRLLFDEAERIEQHVYLDGLAEKLGGHGAARRAAQAVAEHLLGTRS